MGRRISFKAMLIAIALWTAPSLCVGASEPPPEPGQPEVSEPAAAPAPEQTPPPVKARARPLPDEAPLLSEAIEVTATLSERPVDESPAPVLVLQRKDLERSGSLDLSQALGFAPGVSVAITENSARGGGPGVSIQGLDGKHVLILLNGRPFVGDSDGAVDLTSIPVSVIERIEVVSGPMSVLYGGGAIGGVINIITRVAEAGSGGPHLGSNVRYATYNSLDASQALSYGARSMSALLVGNYGASDGFDLDPTWPDTNGERFRRTSGFLSFAWRPRIGLDLRLDTLYGTSDRLRIYRDTQYEDVLDKVYYHDWTWDERRLYSTLSAGLKREKLSVDAWASASYYGRDYADQIEGALKATHRDTRMVGSSGRLQAAWMPSATLSLMAGLEASRQFLDIQATYYDENGDLEAQESEVGAGTLSQVEAFALVDKTFFRDRLEIYGGVRLNYTNLFGFYPPSVLNVRWRPIPLLNLRANLGLGYRTPNLKELNYNFDHSAFGYIIIGNPDLRPERSLNTQLSAEVDGEDRGLLRAGVFFNDVIDLIDFSQLDGTDEDGNLVFQLENISQAVTQGVDAIGVTRVGPFNLSLAYQYLDARDKQTGLPLLYRSNHTAKLNATWRVGDTGIELSQATRLQGRQYVSDDADDDQETWCPDTFAAELAGGWNQALVDEVVATCYASSRPFVVFDARAQARFQLPGGPLTLVFYTGVNNIFDVVRDPSSLSTDDVSATQTLDVRPMPGRVFFLGMRGDM